MEDGYVVEDGLPIMVMLALRAHASCHGVLSGLTWPQHSCPYFSPGK